MADFPLGRRFWRERPRLTRALLISGLFALAFAIGIAWSAWSLVCREGACPDPRQLDAFQPRQTSKLYAADGRFIAELGLERRTLIKLGDIPKSVQEAFIITEDKRFYEHAGIDWTRVFGALAADVVHRNFAQGFSTLTMQLARNIFTEQISREKTMTRKLKEAKVARQIEQHYPKEKILELYLNQIYLGNGAYGVETAAQHYFGKSVRDLNLAEAATLAALPKGPERYNPRRYPDRAIQRRNTIIGLMRNEGVISDADARLAQAYPLQLARKAESGELAPYFVEFVRRQLEQQFGDKIYTDGLKVYTTLDIEMQQAAERNLERQIKAIESGKYGAFKHTTMEQYEARNANGDNEGNTVPNSPYLQGAVISMDPRNGAIRALVGGRDFDDSKFDRATQALRQPGSTFKPIVYADAIHNGRSASYILNDSALTVPQINGQEWTPQNYDLKFMGNIPLREALYLSRNLADDPARHGARRAERDRRGAQVRHHHADSAVSIDPHWIRGRLSDRDGRRVLRVRDARRARRAHRRTQGREREGRDDLGVEPRALRDDDPRRSVADGRHDEGRRATRQRGQRVGVGISHSRSGENRNDERRHRRLVHRLHAGSRHRHLDGLRSSAEDSVERAGRTARRAGVDVVHVGDLSAPPSAAGLAAPRWARDPRGRSRHGAAAQPVLSGLGCRERVLH